MLRQVEDVVRFSIDEILKSVWELVAQNNIQRMVPTNVEKMNVYTFQSLAQINSEYLQMPDDVKPVSDHKNIGVENLLNSFIKIEKKYRSATQTSQINNKSAITTTNAKFKVSKPKSVVSKQPSKINSQRNKEQTSFFKQLESQREKQDSFYHPSTMNKNEDLTKKIELLRDRLIISEQARKKEEQMLQKRQSQSKQRDQILKKKQKQLDKFTYDYNGDFFGSKNQNPESTLGSAAKVRSQLPKQVPKNVKGPIDKLKPRFTTIVNQKLEQRYKRLATQETENTRNMQMFKDSLAARFANSFSNDEDISEGISIKQTVTNFSKFKPINRVGQKLTLSEFKNEISNKKFKQFRMKAIKTIENQGNLIKNKLTSHKSEQNFFEKGFQGVRTQNSQKNQLGSEKNQRYNKMFRSQQSSILSNSKVTKNSGNLVKGSIKIDNLSLYRTVFNDEQSMQM